MPAFPEATGNCNRVRIGMSKYNIALPANTDDLVAIHHVHWLKARALRSVSKEQNGFGQDDTVR